MLYYMDDLHEDHPILQVIGAADTLEDFPEVTEANLPEIMEALEELVRYYLFDSYDEAMQFLLYYDTTLMRSMTVLAKCRPIDLNSKTLAESIIREVFAEDKDMIADAILTEFVDMEDIDASIIEGEE